VNYLQTILERWASSVSSCLLIERVNCVDAGSVGSFSVCSGHRSVQRCVARCRQKRRITRRAAVCSSRVRSAPLICRSHPCGYDAPPRRRRHRVHVSPCGTCCSFRSVHGAGSYCGISVCQNENFTAVFAASATAY